MENRIIYDYVTFTTKIHDLNSAIELLGLSDYSFEQVPYGLFGYTEHYMFNDIHICFGREDMGLMVSMSGQGCRAFETYGTGDYDGLFSEILDNYSEDSAKRQMNLTRLDIAYDDFDGVLDMDVLLQDTLARNFVMRFNKGTIEYEFGNSEEEDYGFTLYYGRKCSNTLVRIYDKLLEQERDDIDHWVRCEIQLRKENAIGFIRDPEKHIGKKYFGVLNNYLRFVKHDDADSNKRRWETADYWQKFIAYEGVISVYCKPGVSYDIHKLDSYVFGQASGAIQTYIDLVGVKQFFERLLDARKGRHLNSKYTALKSRLSQFVDQAKSDTIGHCLQVAYA